MLSGGIKGKHWEEMSNKDNAPPWTLMTFFKSFILPAIYEMFSFICLHLKYT